MRDLEGMSDTPPIFTGQPFPNPCEETRGLPKGNRTLERPMSLYWNPFPEQSTWPSPHPRLRGGLTDDLDPLAEHADARQQAHGVEAELCPADVGTCRLRHAVRCQGQPGADQRGRAEDRR